MTRFNAFTSGGFNAFDTPGFNARNQALLCPTDRLVTLIGIDAAACVGCVTGAAGFGYSNASVAGDGTYTITQRSPSGSPDIYEGAVGDSTAISYDLHLAGCQSTGTTPRTSDISILFTVSCPGPSQPIPSDLGRIYTVTVYGLNEIYLFLYSWENEPDNPLYVGDTIPNQIEACGPRLDLFGTFLTPGGSVIIGEVEA